jgi:glycosyltransferase involved in cell wall biosynthesis
MTLFSIIIPVYNTSNELLSRCIESFMNQTYTDWEIILVDDGSKEETALLCDSFSQHDKRIRTFHQQNAGVSNARNVGLSKARGNWIGFSDSDDELAVDTLSEVFKIIDAHKNVQLVRIPAFYYYGSSFGRKKIDKPSILSDKKSVDNVLFAQRRNEVWNYYIRKDLLEESQFNPLIKIGEDLLFLLPIWERTSCAYFSDKGMYYYYYVEGSAMANVNNKRIETDELLLDELLRMNISDKTLANVSIFFTNLYCRKQSVVTPNMGKLLDKLFLRMSIRTIISCSLTYRQKIHLFFSKYNIYKWL